MLSSITECGRWLTLLPTTRCVYCIIRSSRSEQFIWRLEEKYVKRVVGKREFSTAEVNTFVGDWANLIQTPKTRHWQNWFSPSGCGFRSLFCSLIDVTPKEIPGFPRKVFSKGKQRFQSEFFDFLNCEKCQIAEVRLD